MALRISSSVGLLLVTLLMFAADAIADITLGDVNISSNTTWTEDTYHVNSLSVSSGATLTIAGGSTINVTGSVTVTAGSTILLQGKNTSAQVGGQWQGTGVTLNAANVTVDAGGKITADGQGYVTSCGPGGAAVDDYQSGGSYGGKGGGTNSGPTYGSAKAPTNLGSAGGGWSGGWSNGGGAIRLIVTGTLTNNGAISANGTQNLVSGYSGGGAGGSIYATAGTIAGSGGFSANGTGGVTAYTAPDGGGGGRVAIYYTVNNGFNLNTVTASAGDDDATAGTVYLLENSKNLYVTGNLNFPSADTLSYENLAISNGATLTIAGGSTLTVSNTLSVAGNSTILLQGKNTSAKVDGQWAGVGVTINAANVTVDAGCKITADGQGYVTSCGPGGAAVDDYQSGGSYGGKGGGANSGPTYGSAKAPTDLGSAGGGWSGGWSAGGGAIRLIVSGTLTNNGAISANGTQNLFDGYSGGAAGGSIYATAGTIAGSGGFSANGTGGVTAYTAPDGGGGGRVAIYYTVSNGFNFNTVTANPGDDGATAGTVTISGILEYVWLKPTGDTVHDTVRLEWGAFGVNMETTTVDVTASSNGRVFTIGSRLPHISGTDWDSTTVPDGTYELRLIFRDGAGLVMGEGSKRVLINNSVVWHSGAVTVNQTWTADKVHVIEGTLNIPSGIRVDIDPGAVVKVVKGARIIVDAGGILNASGAVGAPVVFTSLADDSAGGDTNLDGVQTRAVPGDWLGISIQGGGQFNQNSNTDVRFVMMIQGGTLVADHTCPGSQLLHVTDDIIVPNGVTLTIMPGAIIKFDQNKGINVQTGGQLIANGTVSLPIYFTSIKDDTVGGDTNGDGNATTPAAGDWSYISIDGSASFDHATISHGTGSLGMITATGTLTVSNSKVMNATWDGIMSVSGTATITNSILTGSDRAINEHGGAVNVVNCTIDNNRVGIWGTGSKLTVLNSIVTNSAFAGFVTTTGNPLVSYSDIWNPQAENGNGGYSGSGNISADPKYVNRQQLDYRLNFGSPAIDAADGTAAPVNDFMGAPRYDDPRTANTGIATTTGAYADMGALEFAESADSDIDLIASAVTGPASTLVGSQAQLTWTVTNIGSGNAVGPWRDAVYLVRDPDGNKVEIFAGETLVGWNVILGPGQSLTATAVITVPGSVIGNHRWEVRTNKRGEVFEGKNSANNSGVSAGMVAIDLPELTVNGSATPGQFTAVGKSAWYKIEPLSGKDVDVTLALSGGSGDIQLYIGQGYIPDPQHFDIRQNEWNSSKPTVHISSTSTQTYYVTTYAGSLSATPADFSISARTLNFSVTAVQPGSVSNSGNATFEITGGQLSADALYQLLGPNSMVYNPLSVFMANSSDVFVTFNMTGLILGSYDIRVTENATTVTDDDAINVTSGASGLSQIEYDLIVPQAVRAGGQGTVIVTYKNVSGTDAIAPLMWLDASRFATLQEMEKIGCAGPCRVNLYSTGMLLGINQEGPGGVLPPGASGSASFVMKPTVTSGNILLTLNTISDHSAQMNWSLMQASMKPGFVDANAWNAVFANMISTIGSTAGDYNAALAADATYLSRIGIYENNPDKLFAFELMKAGLTTIIPRYMLGAFGRGTSHAFDIWGTVEDSTIALHYSVARVRLLIPDSTTSGQFIGSIGDYGTLAVNSSDQSWDLTEKDGTLLHFKVDPNNANNHIIDYIKDLNGNSVTVNYTGSKVTSIAGSTGDTLQFGHNNQGRIIQTTDEVGRSATYSYDASGEHLLSVTDDGGTTSFAYITGQGAAEEHAVQSITYPDGTHLYFEYDPVGRLTKQYRDGGAETITLAYDSSGEITVTDASENITHILPDQYGQIGQITDPLGAITRFTYDPMNNLTAVLAPQGTTSSFSYDTLGNLTASFDPMGNQQNFGYGSYGVLTSLTDSLSDMLKYSYDSRYNNTAITNPDGSAEQAAYDAHGNLVQWTNRRGRSVTYTYDSHDLLTRKLYTGGSRVDYAYDSRRNLQSLTDSSGTTSITFDSADRLTGINYPNGRFVHYAYDSGGRRSSMTDQTGFAVHYAYDPVGRLSQLSDGSSQTIVAYTYDSAGLITRKTMGNGTYTTYTYDPSGNLLQLSNHAANAVISSYAYTYDSLGRKIAMTGPDGVYAYGYDAAGQLTSVSLPGGGSVQYTYDAAGNRTSSTASGITTDYNINGLNEYTSAGGTAFTYDDDGNLIAKSGAGGTWNYVYDDENRLVGMTGSGNTWTYEYDSLGNRIAQTKNGQRTEYLIDSTGLGNVIAEFGATGTLLAHYTYGFDLTSTVRSAGTASYYHFDGSGNTAQITGAAGNVLNSYSFLPFGEKLSSSETVSNPFTYVGEYGVRDEGNSLYYMRNRWYDPAHGRFTQPDPLGIGGGDANLYSYVSNSVPNSMDPMGLDWMKLPGQVSKVNKKVNDMKNRYETVKDPLSKVPGYKVGKDVMEGVTDGKDFFIKHKPNGDYNKDAVNDPNIFQLRHDTIGDVALFQDAGRLIKKYSFKLYQLDTVQDGIEKIDNAWKGTKSAWRDTKLGFNDALRMGFYYYYYQDVRGKISPKPSNPEKSKNVTVPNSADPNLKITVGYGDQGHVTGDTPLLYTIDFENQPSATAPAQKVVVTDQLNANLDWSTMQLVSVGFNNTNIDIPGGLQTYTGQTNVPTDPNPVKINASINTATGVITWTMESIDPVTGEVPADPYAGFLPPNDSTHRGDGYVVFSVKPRTGLANGTTITNQASIVFDVNAPISTNTVTNTIDTVNPSSNVTALPALTGTPSFLVSWTGADQSGSGIASYDLFVSVDNGPFTAWLTGNAQTSATYNGSNGHTYGFYSIALDNVGHRQIAPKTAQASTSVQTTFNITASVAAGTGTIFCTTPVNAGASSTCTITAGTGYHLFAFTDNGGDMFSTVSGSGYTITNVIADHTVRASFAINTYTVTFSAGPGGAITGSASQKVNYGGSAAQVMATPSAGYHFVNWSGSGGFTSSANPLTFSNVTTDQTLTANFAADQVSGVCGTANGQTLVSAPAANLCSTGTASAVSGAGPWSWSCAGVNGSQAASCSANRVSHDGVIDPSENKSGPDIGDAVKLFQAVMGLTSLTEIQKTHADVAPLGLDGKPLGNGVTDTADVIIMLRYIVGAVSW